MSAQVGARARGAAMLYLAVALGSALGGSLRWLVSLAMAGGPEDGFPWGTLTVNLTGSLIIGLYAALTAPEGRLFPGPRTRHFVMTGICGGYTTFSIFSLEVLQLLQAGRTNLAGLAVMVSLVAWFTAVWAGYALGTRMNRLGRN